MGSSCTNLDLLLHRLRRLSGNALGEEYLIPGVWDYRREEEGVICINPVEYYTDFVQDYLYSRVSSEVKDYLLPLSFANRDENWLANGSIYCLDVRTASSWDHNGDRAIVARGEEVSELGTFLKTLLLLPHIKRLGIDILYLLPILKTGDVYGKGELGSFYAIKNFYQLNDDLHDPLLDLPGEIFPMEVEFKAFIEACHLLGIRVIFDFPLRTASRDNDLLKDHPEWFYWIKKDQLPNYQVPEYDCLGVHVAATPERLHKIYYLPETLEYIKMFSYAPNKLDLHLWDSLAAKFRDEEENILDLIEESYGLTTAPAYADWINDPQPSWDDITFLRLYLDEPLVREGFFDDTTPPFLFFDSIKTNWYRGKVPNQDLWKYLSGIIRHYQENFGIDGARIDMAHALPEDLERMIISRVLEFDPDFKFISEDLQNSNHEIASKKGYHSIIGESWSSEGRLDVENLEKLLRELPTLSIPSFACAETPDTPRAASRDGGRVFCRLVGVMNYFLPNSSPFISNGFDLYERQPMNLGLDNTEEGRYMLGESDLYYGRLAFFDRYQMHWLNEGSKEMLTLLRRAQSLRKEYWSLLNERNAFYLDGEIESDVIRFGYRDKEKELVCLVNLDYCVGKDVTETGEVLISSALEVIDEDLQPGEFRVILRK